MQTSNIHQRAQSTLEYAVFVAVVAAALGVMQVYVRRSIQANLKVLEERINGEACGPGMPACSAPQGLPVGPAAPGPGTGTGTGGLPPRPSNNPTGTGTPPSCPPGDTSCSPGN